MSSVYDQSDIIAFESESSSGSSIDYENENIGNLDSDILQSEARVSEPLNWRFVEEFDDLNNAENFIKDEDIWVYKYKRESKMSNAYKKYYICSSGEKKLKNRTKCNSSLRIDKQMNSSTFKVFKGRMPHKCTHIKILTSKHKSLMRQHYISGIMKKPKKINIMFTNNSLSVLKRRIITNYIQRFKQKYYDTVKNYLEFKIWCENKTKLPITLDSTWVLGYDCISDKGALNYLRAVFSTKRLLNLAKSVNILHVDSTYSVNELRYPLVNIGYTDIMKHYHSICIAVTSKETSDDYAYIFKCLKTSIESEYNCIFKPSILVADNDMAISNGFEQVFGTPKNRINCMFHVMSNIKKHMKGIPVELKKNIKKDINLLVYSPNYDCFKVAAGLIISKYQPYTNTREFLHYFYDNWVLKIIRGFMAVVIKLLLLITRWRPPTIS